MVSKKEIKKEALAALQDASKFILIVPDKGNKTADVYTLGLKGKTVADIFATLRVLSAIAVESKVE